jgi:antitoxin (DNA-binding transcriptional repressor) of toxin-antitoxin stability system
MKRVPLSEIETSPSRFLRKAEGEGILITRKGKPVGLLIGFASEDDWLDFQLENDPRFLSRVKQARESLRAGRGVRVEDLEPELISEKLGNVESGIMETPIEVKYQSLTLRASLWWDPQDARVTRSALDEDPLGTQQPVGRQGYRAIQSNSLS